MSLKVSLADAMELLYLHEINCDVSSFWDRGWTLRIGDSVNGFEAEADFATLEDGVRWLLQTAAKIYPHFKKDTKQCLS